MAFANFSFFSETLGVNTAINIILPQKTKNQIGLTSNIHLDKYPVLYLLHGYSDDHTIWNRRVAVERYVNEYGIAVVMPNGGKGYYTDMYNGDKYWTFISEELMEIVQNYFPISNKKEHNFVAGLSMGGYGAFKLALRCPDKFQCAASFSGALDVSSISKNTKLSTGRENEFYNVFGSLDKIQGSDNDLFYLSSKFKHKENTCPNLIQFCGTEDFLYQDNVRFRDYIKNNTGLSLTYEEWQGDHEWGFWDQCLIKALPLLLKDLCV